jgi:uncharacterized RDD family membrane protein YckC
MPYAGFWRRCVAYLADLLLLALLYAVFFIVEVDAEVGPRPLLVAVFGLVVAWLYFAGTESSKEQATLGKMLVGLHVTDLEGNRITFARATARLFAKIPSALILYIGFIMVAFTANKQGLHDKLAGTLVLMGRAEAKDWAAPAGAVEREEDGAT